MQREPLGDVWEELVFPDRAQLVEEFNQVERVHPPEPAEGSRPTEIEKVWYSCCPSWWAASAVHVTVEAALVIVAPSTVTGAGSFASATLAVQPSMGLTETEVNGVPVGRVTVSLVVLAVSDSLGTLKVSWENPPADVEAGSTWTWAEAAPTPRAMRPAAAARTVTVFRARG